jgi:tetratricopeptide (TPR) repeat protein
MANVAASYRALGRYGEALTLHEEVLALRKAKLRPVHPDIGHGMVAVANCYVDAHRLPDAVKLYGDTLAFWKAKLPLDHPNRVATMVSLARVHVKVDELATAEALLAEALTLAAKRRATTPLETAEIQDALGDCLLCQKEFGKAEPILRACLTTRQEKDADSWETFGSESLLGAALLGQQKYAAAEKLLLAGYEGLRTRADRIPAPDRYVLGDAGRRLVQLYDAWGKKDQADRWRQKVRQPPDPP